MKKILILGLMLFALCPQFAEAQSQRNPCYYKTGSSTSCISVGQDTPLPVTGSISASLGGFHWEATLTPVSASTTPVTTAITAGKTIVIQNIGTTNSAYCALGGTSSANATAVPPNSSVSLTSTIETNITCVTASSTTTLNLQSGTGLWTNFGGGSSGGGGGGGAVTIADGADVTQGALADAPATAGGTGSLSAKLRLMTTQLATINTTLGSPFQAGGSIGNTAFGISGTLPAFASTPTFNLGTLNGASTAANQATEITALNNIATLAASPVPCLNATTSTTNSYSTGATNPANCDLNGNLYVNAKIAAGQTVAATQSGPWTMQPGNTPNTTPWLTTPSAGSANGATTFFLVAAASNNATNVKASAGTVYSIQTSNINASTAYFIKLYDKATAPTCGTDTPVAGYVIPPSNGGNNVVISVGKKFTLGIGFCIVTGIDNNNNGSVPASTILANIDYN